VVSASRPSRGATRALRPPPTVVCRTDPGKTHLFDRQGTGEVDRRTRIRQRRVILAAGPLAVTSSPRLVHYEFTPDQRRPSPGPSPARVVPEKLRAELGTSPESNRAAADRVRHIRGGGGQRPSTKDDRSHAYVSSISEPFARVETEAAGGGSRAQSVPHTCHPTPSERGNSGRARATTGSKPRSELLNGIVDQVGARLARNR